MALLTIGSLFMMCQVLATFQKDTNLEPSSSPSSTVDSYLRLVTPRAASKSSMYFRFKTGNDSAKVFVQPKKSPSRNTTISNTKNVRKESRDLCLSSRNYCMNGGECFVTMLSQQTRKANCKCALSYAAYGLLLNVYSGDRCQSVLYSLSMLGCFATLAIALLATLVAMAIVTRASHRTRKKGELQRKSRQIVSNKEQANDPLNNEYHKASRLFNIGDRLEVLNASSFSSLSPSARKYERLGDDNNDENLMEIEDDTNQVDTNYLFLTTFHNRPPIKTNLFVKLASFFSSAFHKNNRHSMGIHTTVNDFAATTGTVNRYTVYPKSSKTSQHFVISSESLLY